MNQFNDDFGKKDITAFDTPWFKKIRHLLSPILKLAIYFFIVLFIYGASISKSSIFDVITPWRISILKDRPSEITRDIVIDLSYLNTNGGIKTLTENLIEKIAKKRPDWRFIILFNNSHKDFLKFASMKNVKIIEIQSLYNEFKEIIFYLTNFLSLGLLRNKLMQIFLFDRMFLDNKCDMFWDPVSGGYFNDFSIPKVLTIHDLACIDAYHNTHPDRVEWVKKRNLESIKYSKKIITVSNFSKKRIVDEYKIDNDFVRVIPIKLAKRLDNSISKEASAYVLNKYGLSNWKYLIYLSSFGPNKNHDRLIMAFAKFLKNKSYKNISNIKLVLVGEDKNIKKFHRIAAENGIKDRVVFTDFVNNEDLQALLSNALGMIHPSCYEGFGMPIIEAMSNGVPVACSAISSIPEVAGDAAIFFDPYDIGDISNAIATIVGDSKLRNSLIKRGYFHSKMFTKTDLMIDEYIEIFEEVMKSSSWNFL